jgi:hypothetical protein
MEKCPVGRGNRAGTSPNIGRCLPTSGREEVAALERDSPEFEVLMATTRRDHQIVETATEARQGEPGPSVAALLAVSTGLAIMILGIIWFVFFRT